MKQPGQVAIVLHTHMPYVEGFGTWPFGEEWLWEAIATSYLPIADLLDAGAPLTLTAADFAFCAAPVSFCAPCAFWRATSTARTRSLPAHACL